MKYANRRLEMMFKKDAMYEDEFLFTEKGTMVTPLQFVEHFDLLHLFDVEALSKSTWDDFSSILGYHSVYH